MPNEAYFLVKLCVSLTLFSIALSWVPLIMLGRKHGTVRADRHFLERGARHA